MNLWHTQPSQDWLGRFISRIELILATRLGEDQVPINGSLAWELAQATIPNAADLAPEDVAERFLRN